MNEPGDNYYIEDQEYGTPPVPDPPPSDTPIVPTDDPLGHLMRLLKLTAPEWHDSGFDRNEQPIILSGDGSLVAVFAHECINSRIQLAVANKEFCVACHNDLPAVSRQVAGLVEERAEVLCILRNAVVQDTLMKMAEQCAADRAQLLKERTSLESQLAESQRALEESRGECERLKAACRAAKDSLDFYNPEAIAARKLLLAAVKE